MALITDDTSGYGAALSKDFYRQRLYNNVPGVNLTLANYQNFRNEYVLHDLMAQNTAGHELKGIVDAVAKSIIALTQKFYSLQPPEGTAIQTLRSSASKVHSLQKLLFTIKCCAISRSRSRHFISLKPCRPGLSVYCLKLFLDPYGPTCMLLRYLCDSTSVKASRTKTNTTTTAQDSRYAGCVLMQLARRLYMSRISWNEVAVMKILYPMTAWRILRCVDSPA